jgi:hypothetical protein
LPLATPLTTAAIVAIKMLYVEDTLGNRSVQVPDEPNGDLRPSRNATVPTTTT